MANLNKIIRDELSRFRHRWDQLLYPTAKVNSFWARKRFYSRVAKAGELVFDVGANHGNRVEIFLNLGCRVVAFEPQTGCAESLRQRFASHSSLTCVQKALGSIAGELPLLCSPVDTLSTLSANQVNRAKISGRFDSCKNWDDFTPLMVPVSTLDEEIKRFGVPSFVKIDVEGFEPEVLQGLTTPLAKLSFEFTADSLDKASDCLSRLRQLGNYRLNLCHGEAMKFSLPAFLESEEFEKHLKDICRRYPFMGGDIYAQLF